ncbi:ABC-type phosphate/phosphonate transport system substrate-binding protein [Hoeflea marina]|uniref:ABC-type phosphate/phosphonate transport system substrate-binding protein n=1 Tax=Hoeflea marina TaxID=274592 RepID=A0A317PEA9_9HYPH|nr:PhnD/SsuA/transferrin family substrate-binding protein [Hoeflea marina]PWV97258.1 ABC-type phosphate/phosphonate transport system substrate-binding protein [Hoeflea marina]
MSRRSPEAPPLRASLPMYDWPELQDANDRLWQAIGYYLRDRGIDAPPRLSRDSDPEAEWLHPDLLMSQTCGRPYATALMGEVALVGVPSHAATGAAPGRYFSVLVTRSGEGISSLADVTDRRLAYNARNSQSGYASALRMMIAEGVRSLPEPLETGAHRASIRAVAEGRADWAAIDAVTWQLALRHEPATSGLAVFARTPETAALPVITRLSRAGHVRAMAEAWRTAIAALPAADRDALLLTGFEEATPDDYRPLAAAFDPRRALPGLPD